MQPTKPLPIVTSPLTISEYPQTSGPMWLTWQEETSKVEAIQITPPKTNVKYILFILLFSFILLLLLIAAALYAAVIFVAITRKAGQ